MSPYPALLAMAAPPERGASPSPIFEVLGSPIVPLALMFVIFYFLLIAPARRKQKKHADLVNNLKPGDRVVTSGGLYGTVVGVADAVIQLRIADQVKVDVAKHAIADIERGEA